MNRSLLSFRFAIARFAIASFAVLCAMSPFAAHATVATTTTVTLSSPSIAYGSATRETFTVVIKGAAGSGLPSGTLTISGNNGLGTLATVSTAGTCTASGNHTYDCAPQAVIPATTAVNSYTITATYGGSGTYTTSSGTATLSVTTATPTASFTAATGAYGSTVVLTVKNTGVTGSSAPTGAPTIKVNSVTVSGTPSCTASGVVDTCTLSYLLPASLTGSASYPTSVTFAASTDYASSTATGTLTVTLATPTAVIDSAENYYEKNVLLNETNTGVGSAYAAPTGNLTVVVGTQTQNRAKNCTEATDVETCEAKYSIRAAQTAGTYTMTANFAADTNYAASSATNTLTVFKDQSATVVTATPDNLLPGGSTVLAATVTNTSHGALVPTGTVTFTSGSTALGSCTLSSGTCSATVAGSLFGSNKSSTVTASYGGVTNQIATSTGTTTVTLAANIVFTSVTHSFGEVPVGSSEVYTVKLTNNGPSAYAFTLNALSGSSAFTQQTNCPATVAVNGYCELAFTYTPTAAEADTATWSVASDSLTFSPSDGGTLSATGAAGTGVTLTTAGHDFSFQAVGTTSDIYGVVLANATSSPVTLSFSQTDATDFPTFADNCPTTLQAYQTCNLQYDFAPTALGYLSDLITITATQGGNSVTITSGGNTVTGILLDGTGD